VLDGTQTRIQSPRQKVDLTRVAQVLDADTIHEPFRAPGAAVRNEGRVRQLPIEYDGAASSFDRRHGLALHSRAPDDRAQPSADHKHDDHQPPHAEAQESSPGTWSWIGLRRHIDLMGRSL
jgi:hypothetical protein